MIKLLRKNIGTIIASFGFVLLCIITFGDLGEILTEAYWINVKNNLTSIGFLSISLVMIQVSIKQGISEQALQKGLNTENTTKKYEEHRNIIKENIDRTIYMPYFLQIYNERNTMLKKREFLVDNNFKSEQSLFKSKNKWFFSVSNRLIRKYKKIRVYLTASRIKWATTDIVYNKYGQILTLAEHRAKRTLKGILSSVVFMIGVTLLARGLFFEDANVPFVEKFVKLISYIVVIAITSLLPVLREYEKGAFGVPNELDEINEIWREFKNWTVPQWVLEEVEGLNKKEVKDETTEGSNGGTNISVKSKESEMAKNIDANNILVTDGNDPTILLSNNTP